MWRNSLPLTPDNGLVNPAKTPMRLNYHYSYISQYTIGQYSLCFHTLALAGQRMT